MAAPRTRTPHYAFLTFLVLVIFATLAEKLDALLMSDPFLLGLSLVHMRGPRCSRTRLSSTTR